MKPKTCQVFRHRGLTEVGLGLYSISRWDNRQSFSLGRLIAAKGFEKDTVFELAARDIRALPKLEGTIHVKIALIVKFMANYFFNPAEYPEVPQRAEAVNDAFLFRQGPDKGLGKIQLHAYHTVFNTYDLPNVNLFKEQVAVFKTLLARATPTEA
jgi:acyl-CoA dehydrogenase